MSLLLLRQPFPICSRCYRAFSTTATSRLEFKKYDRETVPTEVPDYPYGAAQWYKQSDRGLYGGQRIRFGNNVGPKSGVKTRRSWAVNVFRKRLFSRALNRFIQLKVSQRVMRTIDKVGGLDEYLLGNKESRLKGLGLRGWELRWAIMQTPSIRRKFRLERQALGLKDVENDIERLEQEKLAMAELREVMDTREPVELEADEEEELIPEYLTGLRETERETRVLDAANESTEQANAAVEDATVQAIEDIVEPISAEAQQSDVSAPPRYLRIQVARDQHMYLTPQGWRAHLPKEKPSQEPTRTDFIRRELKPQTKAAKVIINAHNAALREKREPTLSRKDKEDILWQVKKALRTELRGSEEVQTVFNKQLSAWQKKDRHERQVAARLKGLEGKRTLLRNRGDNTRQIRRRLGLRTDTSLNSAIRYKAKAPNAVNRRRSPSGSDGAQALRQMAENTRGEAPSRVNLAQA